MIDLQIYIGEEKLDLFPGKNIALTFQVADVTDLATRKMSYTNQYVVPYTENNDRIYQNARDIRSTTSFPYTTQMVKIIQNGTVVCSNGIHYLKKAAKGYHLFVLFNEAGFFKSIQNKKLWELNATPFKDRIEDARNYRATTSGLIFPLCFSGRQTLTVTNDGMVQIPFWYYKDIINQIFIDAGYTKTGAVFSDSKYDNMVVNVTGSIAGYNQDFVKLRTVEVAAAGTQVIAIGSGTQQDVEFTTVINGGNNPLGYWDGTSKYITNDSDIPNNQVVFDCNVRVNVSFTGTGGQDIRVSLLSGSTTILNIVDLTSIGGTPQTATLDFTGQFPVAATRPYQLNGTGNGLKIVIQRINATTGNVTVVSGSMQIYPLTKPSTFSNGGSSIYPYAYYSELLPDMTQGEFMTDFMVRFGLLSEERDNEVTFKSYNEIIQTVTGKDLTAKKAEEPEEIEFNPLAYAQENIFKYSSADDVSDSVDGSGSIDIDNDNIAESKTIFTSPFAKTLTASVIQILCANVPVFDPAIDPEYLNWWKNEPGARLLLVRDRYAYDPVYPVGASATDYKVAYFEDSSQADQMTFQQFLDDNYSLLSAILQKAKLLNRYYTLDEMDIASLTFMAPIWDTDSFFLQNIVGPFVPGKKTKINLLKI